MEGRFAGIDRPGDGVSVARTAGIPRRDGESEAALSILIDFGRDTEFSFERRLRGYLGAVARAVGVGLESCTLDAGTPAAAYIALDWRLARFPGHDLALVWDEVHGWAAAIEDVTGEAATVLCYLGGEVLPEPRAVVRFLAAVRAGDPDAGVLDAPVLREAGDHEQLLALVPEPVARGRG
jgi:hypothetical protein